jgi:RNA polymerase sigma factor (sigma-70 family)
VDGGTRDTDVLVRNIRRVCGRPDLPLPEPFDPRDDSHVDLAACALLHHFREHDSPDAFTVLVQISHVRATAIARRLTRQFGLAVDPDDLVAAFFANLFVDLRKEQPLVHRFLGFARTAMRNDALNQLRQYRRAQARHALFSERFLGGASDPALVIAEREQCELLQRSGRVFLVVVNQCFHELGERDRRVLIAREVDALSYDGIAAELALPRNQVGMILKRARQRLAARIAASFARLRRARAAERKSRRTGERTGGGAGEARTRESGAD